VETSPPEQTARNPLNLLTQVGWAILILGTLGVCYFGHLGAIGFIGPDEPRYAWIARDMAETGDWVTPHLYGKPWFEKPPLFYWGAAISFKLLGVSETAARLPSAISALLLTLVLAWLTWRLYGAETGRWLLLLLPTTVGMIGFSHAAATDMPFSGMLTIAMVCAAVVLGLTRNENTPILPRTPWLALTLFGVFLGLAVLAKGPAAIVLCGGAVFFWALFTKRWLDAFRLFHPAALVAFCVTALPWYILCARRNPDFLRIFIIEHNFKRYLTPEFQHLQPFWFYAAVLLIALLPWTALALWSFVVGFVDLTRQRRLSPNSLWFLTWSLFCLLFFSLAKSKLPGYILPAIPAVVVLITHARFALAPGRTKALALSSGVASLLFACCFATAEYLGSDSQHANPDSRLAIGSIFGVLSVANLLMGLGVSSLLKGRFGRALAASSVLPILFAVGNADKLLPSFFDWDPSGRALSDGLQSRAIPTDALFVSKNMNRGLHYSLNFYLHEEVSDWDSNNPHQGYLLIATKHPRSEPGSDYTFEELPFDLKKTGYFLYRVQPRSVARSAGSGQPE
jgi:4-amino-4-deoxy-L-arabinose transferase-like glycosyltransferase